MVRRDVSNKALNRTALPLAFIAHSEGSLHGVAELKFRENKSYPEYEHWLGGVFIAPDSRGKGIAGLLIKSALEHISKSGVNDLFLQCEPENVTLYEKFGFRKLHNIKHDDESVAVMSWKNELR